MVDGELKKKKNKRRSVMRSCVVDRALKKSTGLFCLDNENENIGIHV
jgi:hypothetical protein